MSKLGQRYRAGIWVVKPGKVEEFIQAWQASAEWLAENQQGDSEGLLLQDLEDSHKFISFAFTTTPEFNEALLSGSEFQASMAKIRALCEEIQPHRMRVVGHSLTPTSEN